ncbi:MAG TPA: histidine phosphatase family protein [Stellaceae bacterium]|nr:histidine phosphatase family protein [Stellaceae bacterium]
MGDVTRWWWVRHAPVTVNQGCCYGQTDFPCDVADTAAFAALAPRLPRDAVWIASPLRRTHMTAAALVAAGAAGPDPIPGPGIHIDPELIEQHFGAWQGVKYSELHARRGDEWHRFWLAPAHEVPPGGESFAALTERVQRAVLRLSAQHSGRDIVSVSHGGTIRAALALALNLAPEHALAFAIDNTSLTRIEHFSEPAGAHGWRVVAVNQPPR